MIESVVIYSGDEPRINLDAVTVQSESHTADNEVVEQVLENGSQMTDHIIIKPDLLEISFIVTNVNLESGATDILSAENAKTVWNEFKRLRNERVLVSVVTTHENYTNMAIENLSAVHEAPYKGQLKYTVKLKKINQTSFNTGSNDPDNYDENSDIAKSAVSSVDKGYITPTVGIENEQVVNNVLDQYYPEATTSAEYTAAKNDLIDTLESVRVNDNEVLELTTNINGVNIKFKLYYNDALGLWLLDIINIDEEIGVYGLTVFFDVNLLNGLDIDMPTNNLFVTETILSNGNKSHYIYWYDLDQWNLFNETARGLQGARPLNFDIDDMDYTAYTGYDS